MTRVDTPLLVSAFSALVISSIAGEVAWPNVLLERRSDREGTLLETP